jgi:hypothetical protein
VLHAQAMQRLSTMSWFLHADAARAEENSAIWHDTVGFARVLVLPALNPDKEEAAAASRSPWRPNAKALRKASDALMVTLEADNEAATAADDERSSTLSQLCVPPPVDPIGGGGAEMR